MEKILVYYGSFNGNLVASDLKENNNFIDNYWEYVGNYFLRKNKNKAIGEILKLDNEKDQHDSLYLYKLEVMYQKPFIATKPNEYVCEARKISNEKNYQSLFRITEADNKKIYKAIDSTKEEISFISDSTNRIDDCWMPFDFEKALKIKGYDIVFWNSNDITVLNHTKLSIIDRIELNLEFEHKKHKLSELSKRRKKRSNSKSLER